MVLCSGQDHPIWVILGSPNMTAHRAILRRELGTTSSALYSTVAICAQTGGPGSTAWASQNGQTRDRAPPGSPLLPS